MRSPDDGRPIGDPIGPTALTRPDPQRDRFLILSTAYVVTRAGKFYEIIAARDHDADALRLLVHTFDESLYTDALRVEGTDERISLLRCRAFHWRTIWP